MIVTLNPLNNINFPLIKKFVIRDIKCRYSGTFIGIFWAIILPIINLGVFTFIFSVVLKINIEGDKSISNFAIYLFCGMLPWIAFQESILRSTSTILENSTLLQHVSFPPITLPIYIVISSLVNQLFGTVILIIAILIKSFNINYYIILFPLVLFLQFIFTLGVSLAISSLSVFFRDLQHITSAFLMIGMYITPIFYPEKLIPLQFKFIVTFNPIAYIIRIYRDIFLSQHLPNLNDLFIICLISVTTFIIGYMIFKSLGNKFIDMV